MRGDLRENLLLWLARIPERIGYGVTGGGFFLTKELDYRPNVHESAHTLDVLESMGIRCDRLEPRLYFSEKEKALPEKFKDLSFNSKEKWIGVQLEAGTQAKEWPIDQIRDFVELCVKELSGYKIVLVGANAVKTVDLPQNVRESGRFIDLTGKTSLRELLLILKNLKMFIGPDSGPTHLAAALGVPTLFLYSGTNRFEEWKPLAKSAYILRHDVSCAPCGRVLCNVPGHPCMSGIEPVEVVRLIKEKAL